MIQEKNNAINKKNNFSKIMVFVTLILITTIIFSETTLAIEPVAIRVVSANPSTRTYTFACLDNGSGLSGNGVRNWFIYPEDTNIYELSTSLPANQSLTFTFNRTAYYDITCEVPNPPGLNYTSLYRHSMHIDLRTQLGNPAVIPLSVAPGQVTEKCLYNGTNYTTSWFLSTYSYTGGSGNTVRYSLNNTNNTITFTAPFAPGLFDTHCLIHLNNQGIDIDTPNGVDFASTSNAIPYIGDQYGINLNNNFAPLNYNAWIALHNSSVVQPPVNNTNSTNSTNNTLNGNINLTSTPGAALVTLNGIGVGTTSAGTSGNLFMTNITQGSKNITVSKTGFLTNNSNIIVISNQTILLNVILIQNTTANNTNTTGNNTNNTGGNGTIYTTVYNIPANCTGGSITSDTTTNGRAINCSNGPNSLSITAWNKPSDTAPQFFEMYNQGSTGSGIQICLLSTCISNNGFALSPNFPIIGPSNSNTTTNNTNTTNITTTSIGNINLTTIPSGASVNLNGNFVGTTPSNGNLFINNVTTGTNNITIGLSGYKIYQSTANVTANKTLILNVQLQSNPANNGSYNTNPNNQPPQPPTWLEPGATGVYPNDFHLHVNNAVDPENDTIIYSDYEIWDVAANQLVWASYKESVDPYHIHKMDGTFMGNLANSSILKYSTTYQVRARFYEFAQFNNVSNWSSWRVFQTIPPINITPTATSWTPAPGYDIRRVASNISLPVNVIMAPNLYGGLPFAKQPLLYVTQLYGQIGVILQDGTYRQYAGNLLSAPSPGGIPGGGEAGVDGLYVDQTTGDVYISMSYVDNTSITGMSAKLIHFVTNATGDGFKSSSIIIDKIPVRPSHEAHTILKGPDGKMYLSIGDADQLSWPQDPTKYNGKVLRMNWDGSMPSDNPFPGTFTYALGFRNPFGMAFRPGTSELYVSNNGQDTDDGLYKTFAGSTFGWPNSLTQGVWVNWHVEIAPTQVAFDSYDAFPKDANNVYVVGSGSTYLQGPSPNSKRIFQIAINSDGTPGTPTPIATYTGAGYGDPIGLAFASDGAYFTDIYGDAGFTGAGITQGNIYKVIWTGQNSTNTNQTNTTTPPSGFSAVIAQHPWYPQGLNMIWDCKTTGGSGNFTYDFVFGDGNQQLNYNQNNVWHTYAAHGTYSASCTVHDLSNSQTATGSTSLTI